LDSSDASIAAAWHGRIEPALFADQLALLGDLYQGATIGVENNPGGHGNIVLLKLRDGGYENIHSHAPDETRTDPYPKRLGFHTDRRTKPMLIDGIGEYLEALGTKGEHGSINDAELIGEI
jgi:hypothetical protein